MDENTEQMRVKNIPTGWYNYLLPIPGVAGR
jgi:hypothetical protein